MWEEGGDILMVKSTDSGEHFSNPKNLSNTPNLNSENPRIAASGNAVYVVWEEGGDILMVKRYR